MAFPQQVLITPNKKIANVNSFSISSLAFVRDSPLVSKRSSQIYLFSQPSHLFLLRKSTQLHEKFSILALFYESSTFTGVHVPSQWLPAAQHLPPLFLSVILSPPSRSWYHYFCLQYFFLPSMTFICITPLNFEIPFLQRFLLWFTYIWPIPSLFVTFPT